MKMTDSLIREANAGNISTLNRDISTIENKLKKLELVNGIQLVFKGIDTWQTGKDDNTELVNKVLNRVREGLEIQLRDKKKELKEILKDMLEALEEEENK